VLSTCSTLLTLVNLEDSQVIQFSHFSVKEFLTSSHFAEKHDTLSQRYHISTTLAHTLVAQACLGILLHLDENITSDNLDNFPLSEYAAEHWFEHAHCAGVSENAVEGIKELFDEGKSHLGFGSGYGTQRTPRSESRELDGHFHPMEPLYITRLFVAYVTLSRFWSLRKCRM
jgi:hypothetical protein